MVLPSDATLRLIKWLARLDADGLLFLAERRNLKPSDLQSLTTVALALADNANIQATLQTLPRSALQVLSALAAGTTPSGDSSAVSRLGFIDDHEGTPLLLCREDQLVSANIPDQPALTATVVPGDWDQAALARAGTYLETMLCVVDDLVGYIARWPVPVNKDGLLGVSSHKVLQETLGDALDLAVLTRFLLGAGVLARQGSTVILAASQSWKDLDRTTQWELLARSWWETEPSWLHDVFAVNPGLHWDNDMATYVGYHFPLLGDAANLATIRVEAQVLGIIHEGRPTPWGLEVLSHSPAKSLASFLPEPVPGVYANEDFTFLAPGPLSTEHRTVLDRFTQKEHGGLVPRYRLTSTSIIEALQSGEEEKDIVDLLQSTSQNPLPQGMVHLVQDTIRHAHNIQLSPAERGTNVLVGSPQLALELLADPALQALTLSLRGESELTTTWPIERVHSALASARYVALMARRPAPASTNTVASAVEDPLHAAVEKLAASIAGAEKLGIPPWLGSMIEVATEHKIPLEIECEMPGGIITTLVMEPRSLSNGRLRGLELKNAMEKTIPVSCIKRIAPFAPGVDVS